MSYQHAPKKEEITPTASVAEELIRADVLPRKQQHRAPAARRAGDFSCDEARLRERCHSHGPGCAQQASCARPT